MVGQPAGLPEELVVLGQEGVVRGRRREQVGRVSLSSIRSRWLIAARQLMRLAREGEPDTSSSPGARGGTDEPTPWDKVGRHDGVPCAQPVAVVLRRAHEYWWTTLVV